jgi:hypothetical protein
MDFDPRDFDARDDERHRETGADGHDNHDDDLRLPDEGGRDRDDDARSLGRGPGDSRQSNNDTPDPRDDTRWPERDRDAPGRNVDPREPFTRHVHLPRGPDREIVRDRDREYTLRGSETPRLQPSARFEWSPVVISEAIAIVR